MLAAVSEQFLSFPPKNGHRKDDYIMEDYHFKEPIPAPYSRENAESSKIDIFLGAPADDSLEWRACFTLTGPGQEACPLRSRSVTDCHNTALMKCRDIHALRL